MGFGVWGLGLGGLGFRVYGLDFWFRMGMLQENALTTSPKEPTPSTRLLSYYSLENPPQKKKIEDILP